MPQYVCGNLWDEWGVADLLLVTTNSTVRRDGTLVMGRGAALEAQQRYPALPARLGHAVLDRPIYGIELAWYEPPTMLGVFQVKAHWRDEAWSRLFSRRSPRMSISIRERGRRMIRLTDSPADAFLGPCATTDLPRANVVGKVTQGLTRTVLYHARCPDGRAAAYACWQQFGGTADYLPVSYGQPLPDIPADHAVYIVDFSYPEPDLKRLVGERIAFGRSRQPCVTVLDHHASAQRELESLVAQGLPGLVIHFDLEECGASLAWKYFASHGHLPDKAQDLDAWAALDEAMPRFFHFVRDRDLWLWRLQDSKEVSMAYHVLDKSFRSIDRFAPAMETPDGLRDVVREGAAMLHYADTLIREQVIRAKRATIGGYTVPVVNATTLFSEVGEALCRQFPEAPFAAYYFDREDGRRQWGLQSSGSFDCSVVAQQFGGGGHPGAAGFLTDQTWAGDQVT